MKAEIKDFMFRCRNCKEQFASDSLKAARDVYRRHAKKHESKDFPLHYDYSRWNGENLKRFGVLNENGDVR